MLSTRVFTTRDLDAIGCRFRDQSLDTAAELVNAVDQGRVAEPADTGYALVLAAEITERDGTLQDAEALAQRAVEVYRANGDPYSYPRVFHAGLLMRLGREDEAMTELTALCPLLSEDADAVSNVSEALEEAGRSEIAEQWLTDALVTALQRWQSEESQRGQTASERPPAVVYTLMQYRHQLRRDLDLPHDAHDHLAEQMLRARRDALSDDEETALPS